MGAPCYTHLDAAPLRVLSRLLSSKYLHVEIREKGMYGTTGSFMINCNFRKFYLPSTSRHFCTIIEENRFKTNNLFSNLNKEF